MEVKEMIRAASEATLSLQMISEEKVSKVLREVADALRGGAEDILQANQLDLAKMSPDNPKYDRLKLTEARIAGIASDMENVAGLPSPLGKVLSETERPRSSRVTTTLSLSI